MNVSNKSKRKTNKETERERDLYDPTVKTTDFGLSGAMICVGANPTLPLTRARAKMKHIVAKYTRVNTILSRKYSLFCLP